MNILFVIPNLAIGGAQSFLLRLVSAMANKNHTIVLLDVHPKKANNKFYEALLSEKVILIASASETMEMAVEKSSPKILSTFFKRLYFKFFNRNKTNGHQLESIIKKYNIDVINSHMYLADIYIHHLKSFVPKHVKWILSFHGCYNLLLDKTDKNRVPELRAIISNSDGVIMACDKHNTVFSNLELSGFRKEKIYYGFIPHSYEYLNLRQKYNIADDALIFGMVARGDISKGWQPAIDAFNLVEDKKDAYLILTGDGSYLEKLEETYSDTPNIVFTGPTDKPLQLIEHFDVGFLPTTYAAESLPNSVIEYLYANKPVIASDWAEIPQMITSKSGMAGTIVSVHDNQVDIQKLSDAFTLYMEQPQLISEHSVLAKEAYKQFDMDKCITNYLNFYN